MDYDSRYLKEKFYWGKEPNDLVVRSIKYIPSNAKVLDLGCGEGRNSFFLARNDFNVTAVDISKEGLVKLNKFADQEKMRIETCVSDIISYLKECATFVCIFGINILQFIDEKNIISVIDNMKSKTEFGGINIIASFVAKTPLQRKLVISKGGYLFNEGELKELYKDWKVLFYEEKLGEWETHGEPRHRHYLIKMIARKE